MIVEWVHADDDHAVAGALARIPKEIWTPAEIVLQLQTGQALLFWAPCAENEVKGPGGDHLEVRLTPGAYEVTTAEYKPDPETWLRLHRLVRAT